MAPKGQASRQAPQRVQCSGWVRTACLRWPEVSRVIRCSGQAATQRPQPEQRAVSMSGNSLGFWGRSLGIAKQVLLFPLFGHLLLLA